jgi:Ferritin-like domain
MSDELRRQMRDAELAQRDSMGPFRDAVMRFASGDPAFNRRGLFVAGGGLMAVVLAACADHSAKPQVPEGGNATPTTVTIAPPPVDDVTLLRTASSIEVLAVQTYQSALDSGLITTPALKDGAELFQRQHQEHADLFEAATREAGGEPYTEANPNLQFKVVDTLLPSLETEADVVNMALELEDTAGGSYQVFASMFTTRELRQTVQSVGAVERRHSIILTSLIPDEQLFPSPFGNVTLAVGSASYV